MKKTAVLLIQLGTPDSPKTSDVRRYLGEFLNDPRVIDLPWLARKLLVNGIIVPFRAPKSAKIYKELWKLGEGQSPLLVHLRPSKYHSRSWHRVGEGVTGESDGEAVGAHLS